MVEHPRDGKVPLDMLAQRDDESTPVYLARLAHEAALNDYQRNFIRIVATPPSVSPVMPALPFEQTAAFMWTHQMVGSVRRAARAALKFLDGIDDVSLMAEGVLDMVHDDGTDTTS